MSDFLTQIMLVFFLVAIATYDTLQSKRKQVKDNPDKTRELIDLPG